MRELKQNIIKNDEIVEYFLNAVDDKVDVIIDTFEENPIKSANELKRIVENNINTQKNVQALIKSTNRLIHKGKNESDRKKPLIELEEIRDALLEIRVKDFLELTVDENLDAKEIVREITDILHRIKKGMRS